LIPSASTCVSEIWEGRGVSPNSWVCLQPAMVKAMCMAVIFLLCSSWPAGKELAFSSIVVQRPLVFSQWYKSQVKKCFFVLQVNLKFFSLDRYTLTLFFLFSCHSVKCWNLTFSSFCSVYFHPPILMY
jgi:hypothetical protein